MGIEDYKRLIEEFCVSEGIDDVGALLHRGFIDIDEVSMKFEYLDASRQCRVLADLGEIPSEHESELRGLMLENNFSDGNYAMPVLSIHPDTGRAVLAVHLPLAGVLAEGGLMRTVEQHVQPLIKWWNELVAQLDETPVEEIESAPLVGAYA